MKINSEKLGRLRLLDYLCNEKLKMIMNGDHTKRLPQKSECREDSEGGILESASTFAYRVLKEIEALAGTTACKSVQLISLLMTSRNLVGREP